MKCKKTVSVFFSIAFIGACVVPGSVPLVMANSLMLHGQLVNAGCDAKVLSAPAQHHELKSLKVSTTLSLSLASHDDACEGAALPVSTAYAERASIIVGAHNGIVTLTYQ
ncbi:hypothetical protein ACI2KS_03045 [Pseudomonas sp. NPDC087358]|uniref:hypothetical protein n=1 Tax=Pseudomonas sp. NPDC087358 TaxID=3364439 RepID=UPI00384F310E